MREKLIEIKELKKEYLVGSEKVEALKGVNLTVERGEYLAIMGPSGSGKSTVMNVIGCLDKGSSGTYLLNGIDVSHMDEEELADIRNREIGFVFQTFNLLPRYNALENAALPLVYSGISKKEREGRAKEALEKVGLLDRLNHRPNELSGGERQRVAIARALINNPSIILADEPTGNLDSKNGAEIMELFNKINSLGNSVIVVTHEEEIANYTKRIVRLRDGTIESDINI